MEVSEEEIVDAPILTLRDVFLNSVAVEKECVKNFKFIEDVTVQGGSDRYILVQGDDSPVIFRIAGVLTSLNVTASGAIKHRRPIAKIDEYTVRLQIVDDVAMGTIDTGFKTLVETLKKTKNACENIAVSAGLVESRKSFKLEDTVFKVSNFSNNTIYFNRKVASREPIPDPDDSETPDFMRDFPKIGKDYPVLKYPTGWHLNPFIPVSDETGLTVSAEKFSIFNMELPRNGTVYFELKQACYNFQGKDGPVKQIVLVPAVVGVKVSCRKLQQISSAQTAKRRRISI